MQFWLTFATQLNFLNIEVGVHQITGKGLLFTLVLHTVLFFFFGQFLSSVECVHIELHRSFVFTGEEIKKAT